MFRQMLTSLNKNSQAARQTRASRRRQLCMLEGLEERVLLASIPTVFMVTNASGSAAQVGSLPSEIKKANANPNTAGSVIKFSQNVFKASSPRTITLSKTLALTATKGPEVIDGPGASIVTISGNNAVVVFTVENGVRANLSGLTVSGGNGANSVEGVGGILNDGTLTVANSTIAHNSGDLGGGFYNAGTLTVTGSTIEGNTNETSLGGGGITNYGTLTVTGSTIESNKSFNGGGINNVGTLTVNSSNIENNTATESGGGIENGAIDAQLPGTLTIFESTIAGNSAPSGAGIDTEGGALTVIGSTVAGNSGALYGGGVEIFQSTVILANSTIAGNSATVFGGGIENGKGGSLFAVNCTIAYNSVPAGGTGAGLYVDLGATTTLENTIVADNVGVSAIHVGPTVLDLRSASEIDLAAGATDVSGSYDLIGAGGPGVVLVFGTGGSGGLTNGTHGNKVGVEALLGTLAENGGPTETIALLSGSPAIDAGNVGVAHYDVSVDETLTFDGHTTTIVLTRQINLTTDQRGTGFERTHNGTVDIGAFEVQPA